MESIFQSVGVGFGASRSSDRFDGESEYESGIRSRIRDAVDYTNTELSPIREDSAKYYDGKLPAPAMDENDDTKEDANKSSMVSTDVRDTVLAIMPSLMRIFTGPENVVYYIPTREDQEELARQQMDYVNKLVWKDNDGFLIISDVFKDALTQKFGVVKWWTEESQSVKERSFRNITLLQLSMLIQEYSDAGGKVEVVGYEASKEQQGVLDEVTLRYIEISPKHCIASVPPEEFVFERRASKMSTSRLVGQQTFVTPSFLVERGVDMETIDAHKGNYNHYHPERENRFIGGDSQYTDNDLVPYGEYYVYVDSDGDGIDELHLICTIGDEHEIISDDVVDSVNYALFYVDPRPHTMVGDDIADITKDIQDVNTQIIRGSIESLWGALYPDYVVNDMLTEVDDIMADGVGKLIRTRTSPDMAVKEFRKTFIGGQAFEMMSVMDGIRQRRTGISEASKGLDPKALQSTNVMGVDAIVSGAQERIELIAMYLANTGYKALFKGLLEEVSRYPAKAKTERIRGKWVEINPSLFDASMGIEVNPNMGKTSDISRLQTLMMVKDVQLMIMDKFGVSNEVVTPIHFLNTIEDIMELSNVRNFGRYFGRMTEDRVKQLAQAPKEPTPEEKIATAELEKVKAQTAGKVAEASLKKEQMELDEDFRRDKLTLDTLVGLVKFEDSQKALDTIHSENQFNG